ncbi:MAG: aminotransferase class IV [Saprospiraceae bacterium]|nr:aminotransferase class IV [Saprospiraceae bacterium]
MYYTINGNQVHQNDASIQVGDLALLRGYGLFDYFQFEQGIPVFLDDYLDRFYNSAEGLGLVVRSDRAELTQDILALIARNDQTSGGIRLVLTGGYSPNGYLPAEPNLLILQYPKPSYPETYFHNGIKLITHPYSRDIPHIKTLNYLMGIHLLPKLEAAGALEPLYHSGEFITETTRSNIFFVMQDQTIATPAEGILQGITRKQVIQLARKNFDVAIRDFRLDELCHIQEAFITGTNKKVMPVIGINKLMIGEGRPGPVTRILQADFEDHIQQYITQVQT